MLYSNDLLKYKKLYYKKNASREVLSFWGTILFAKTKNKQQKIQLLEKSGTATKVKLAWKVMKQNQFYFATLVLVSYCLCGDNA